MAEVALKNLTKRFGSVVAVDKVNLLVKDREFFTILGPSGAGKTTLLRLIAGFEEPNMGTISFDGEPVNGLTPYERKVKMIFQSLALWPHMQVYNRDRFSNLSFGLRLKHKFADEIERIVAEVAGKVGISRKLFRRRPTERSGGEKQRVAIG